MCKRKLIQKIMGATLCLSLLSGEALLASATQMQKSETVVTSTEQETVEQLTPEVPTVATDEVYKRPVGGVQQVEYLELPENAEGVEIFEGKADEASLTIEDTEEINGSRSSAYGYNTLSAEEKKVYNLLKTRIFAFDVSAKNATCVERNIERSFYASEMVDVSDYQMTLTQMERIYFALEADYPMMFWLDDAIAYNRTGMFVTKWYIMVEPDYAQYSVRRETAQSIEKGIVPFLEEIDNAKVNGADHMELELLIHDMIIEEVDYAYDSRNEPETAAFAHSIVGVFDDKSSTDVVCEGYAKAFHLLATYAGLESIYAVGMSGTGFNMGGHAWNLVKVNGNWYNIDLTWNDTNSTAYDGYRYDYFNLTTSIFNQNKEHDYRSDIFPGMYGVPTATATKEEYYNYFGLRITESKIATETAFINVMKNAISSNKKRRDNMLRFQCEEKYALELMSAYLSDGTTCNNLYEQLNENGVSYAKTEFKEYTSYNQILVSINKIYVDNMCEGYVFGNPKTDAKVYEWNNRVTTDITSQCNFTWSGSNKVTITNNGKTLGNYNYTAVTPVIGNIGAAEYTGSGICPKVSVVVNGTILQSGKDYIAEYSNNLNPGTAKVTIKGIGNYAGTFEKTFTIQKRNLANLVVSLAAGQYSYNGTAKTPEVIAKNDGNTLVAGKDYTVTYRNNINPGQASVAVTGIGNYTGSKTLTFIIVPGKPGSVKLSKGTGKTLTFSWKKQTGASGYEVTLYKGSKKVKTATTTKTQYQFKTLKENTQYSFHVRAYKTINGSKKYGNASSKLTVKTASKAPTNLKITVGKKSATLKWKKTSGVTGYEVYTSGKSNSGFKKVATVKGAAKVKYTKKKLKASKTYYFKVRSYTTKNGQKSYSNYTSVKKIKTK